MNAPPDFVSSLRGLIDPIASLVSTLRTASEGASVELQAIHPVHHDSALNLVQYLALRRHDVRELQDRLAEVGLSSLGRAESCVGATLENVLELLVRATGEPQPARRLSQPTLAQGQRLLERNTPSAADYRAREARVIRAAQAMADGTGGPCRRPDESWDRAVIAALEAGATDAYDGMTDADIDREAGFGGHEIRCWIAACAAMRELGGPRPRLDYYRLVPEWITGMGLMTAGEP